MDFKSKPKGVTKELLPITKRVDGTTIGIPVITVRGKSDGITMLIAGAIHGDEQESIHTVLEVVSQINPDELCGTLVGIPVVNVPAYEHRKRGYPLDDWFYDLNRGFPGSPKGSFTQRLADKILKEVASGVDVLISPHSGGSNLCCCKRSIMPNDSEKQMKLGKAMGPGWEILAVGAGERKSIGNLTVIAAQDYDLVAITPELGGINDRLPDAYNKNVEDLVKSMFNVMKEYGMIEGEPEYAKEVTLLAYEPIRNDHGGLIWLKPDCRLMREVTGGTELLEITDFFGATVELVKAPYDGIMVAIPAQPSVPTGGCQIATIGKVLRRVSV